MIDINEILKILPHRYPFLLVDRVVEFEAGKKAKGIKNVTINEPFFQGHFPGHPIMPGVLIIEAMAQVGGILAFKSAPPPVPLMEGDKGGGAVYFMGIDKAKFRKPVLPGDRLELVLEVTKQRGVIWVFKGEAFVDGNLVSEAELMATIVDK
ncbi:MAG: 3-hydroxyacyl-[acyl-carrier-protein] dehydratase FabZ [Deltaproteobacteria bacterium RIFCSPLOWO2_12_FULL_43_16]|nr:MAG: 3-hydroxyacyl-[acyl-carrier-protein] dehydratase FabZ [Deltaproteobacteria bacterium GWA2_43_19]OGQ11941.1 MAG: 3-hydroxyacyl-[acyl-carrier-protein] dehydratase FabZ [Deltaproteobacteria bacterium RIFCSPHIGHO2_02_FULL_43_33]OGQ33591.1 MAG: 3-hydroxyacyl-[acyl-carrier-protein] dehydratase FabZ [Deltaproteobacteria bacterium RIFCSPLOWO2_01_FULL_42_9]OGQ61435.1 MAG: 3-hydroxyacyl-[acyl-carrier-protein] dehydratase FabZ [Deltaproteobacteria bacterium RIFCSPLOWO2_12_FULL_43_16]HBR18442.1 3-h